MTLDRNLLINAFTGDDEAEYQLGTYYYLENSDREAIFWLNRSIKKRKFKSARAASRNQHCILFIKTCCSN